MKPRPAAPLKRRRSRPPERAGFASETPTSSLSSAAHRAHVQRFCPSDWVGEDDLVRPKRRVEKDGAPPTPPRFFAFVTRAKDDAPPPVMQLRPYRGRA